MSYEPMSDHDYDEQYRAFDEALESFLADLPQEYFEEGSFIPVRAAPPPPQRKSSTGSSSSESSTSTINAIADSLPSKPEVEAAPSSSKSEDKANLEILENDCQSIMNDSKLLSRRRNLLLYVWRCIPQVGANFEIPQGGSLTILFDQLVADVAEIVLWGADLKGECLGTQKKYGYPWDFVPVSPGGKRWTIIFFQIALFLKIGCGRLKDKKLDDKERYEKLSEKEKLSEIEADVKMFIAENILTKWMGFYDDFFDKAAELNFGIDRELENYDKIKPKRLGKFKSVTGR